MTAGWKEATTAESLETGLADDLADWTDATEAAMMVVLSAERSGERWAAGTAWTTAVPWADR